MPQDGPTEWTNALRENGRLTIGPERTRLLVSLLLPAGILLLNGFRTIAHLTDGGPWEFVDYFRAIFGACAGVVLVGVSNNVRTRHWLVVVDSAGVALGRQRLAWSEISAVAFADDQVVVRPVAGTPEVKITSYTLRDLRAFARWLAAELAVRRTG